MSKPIKQVTIIGLGLIGGSLAFDLRGLGVRVVGCDREPVLRQAQERGALDEAIADAVEACGGSQMVVLATPVDAIIDLLERLGPVLPPEAWFTDVGSTKLQMVARAQAIFGAEVGRRFLPGHPMAGKEHSGIEHAEPGLFRGAAWLFTPIGEQKIREGIAGEFVALIEALGARVMEMDAARHDRLCAWVSQLPQMLSTALAATLVEEFGDDAAVRQAGGRALREMTRIAASPYSMWRDIALTNSANLESALLKLEQRLALIRENLRTPGLRAEFERANAFARPQRVDK